MADDVGLLWQLDGAGQFIEYGRARDIFEHPTHELTAAYVAGMRG